MGSRSATKTVLGSCVLGFCLWAGASSTATAQAPPAFAAVSIKRFQRTPGMRFPQNALQTDPAGIHAFAHNLRYLIDYAYGIEAYQLAGGDPSIVNPLYNLDASTSAPATDAQLRLMLRGALKDRFGLQLGKTTRLTPVVAVVVGPGGFKPLPPASPPPPGTMAMQFTSLPDMIGRLSPPVSHALGRMLVDATGLTGTYSIRIYLPFTMGTSGGRNVMQLDAHDIPPILKRLGLVLKPETISLTTYTIQNAHAPTPN